MDGNGTGAPADFSEAIKGLKPEARAQSLEALKAEAAQRYRRAAARRRASAFAGNVLIAAVVLTATYGMVRWMGDDPLHDPWPLSSCEGMTPIVLWMGLALAEFMAVLALCHTPLRQMPTWLALPLGTLAVAAPWALLCDPWLWAQPAAWVAVLIALLGVHLCRGAAREAEGIVPRGVTEWVVQQGAVLNPVEVLAASAHHRKRAWRRVMALCLLALPIGVLLWRAEASGYLEGTCRRIARSGISLDSESYRPPRLPGGNEGAVLYRDTIRALARAEAAYAQANPQNRKSSKHLYNWRTQLRGISWKPKDMAEGRSVLSSLESQDALPMLRRLARQQTFDFGWAYETNGASEFGELSALPKMLTALLLSARLAALDGSTSRAKADMEDALRLTALPIRDPLRMVAYARRGCGMDLVRSLPHILDALELAESDLAELQELCLTARQLPQLPQLFACSAALTAQELPTRANLPTIHPDYRVTFRATRVRWHLVPKRCVRMARELAFMKTKTYWWQKPTWEACRANFGRNTAARETSAPTLRSVFWRAETPHSQAGFRAGRTHWSTDQSKDYIEHMARMDALRIALGLKRYRLAHGESAPSLEALAPRFLKTLPPDPFTGEPFKVKRVDGKVTVYSVGANLTDDGGRTEAVSMQPKDNGVTIAE